ncbi:hypothetical protein KC333_g6741 [Hortaea werneckii]|nr:hypothetical protein KC333_g6741 [Hortaea werneckii]KAI7310532.1 hypothetical protein KC326_g6644 [Hortaea werneckii]
MAQRVQKAWSRNYEAEETANRYRRELHGAPPQEYQQTEWEESLMSLLKEYCESPNEHSNGDAQAVIAPLCHSLLGYDPFQALEKEEQNADAAVRDAEIARTEASEAVDRANKANDELEQLKAHVIAVEASNRRKAERYQVEVRRVHEITNARDKALKDKEQAVNEAGELRSLHNEAVTERSTAIEEMLKAQDERVKSEHAAKISAAEAKEARSQAKDAQKQSRDAHAAAQSSIAAGRSMQCEIAELQENLRRLGVVHGELRVAKNCAEDDLRSQVQDRMQTELTINRQQGQIAALRCMLLSAQAEIEDWRVEEQLDRLRAFSAEKKLSKEMESQLRHSSELLSEAEERNRVLEAAIQEKDTQLHGNQCMLADKTDALDTAIKKNADLQEKCDQQSAALSNKTQETEECEHRLQAESIARREVEDRVGAVQEQLNRETATLSQERERLDQTRDNLNNVREELARREEELKSQLHAAIQRTKGQEHRANSLDSQLTVSTRDLASLQQKYERLKTEATNHWRDMSEKTTSMRAAQAELNEAQRRFDAEKQKYKETTASMETQIQDLGAAETRAKTELSQVRESLLSLEGEKRQLLERIENATKEMKAAKANACQSQADMGKLTEELRSVQGTSFAVQREKQDLLDELQGIRNAVEHDKKQFDSARELVEHYRTAFEELIATVLPDEHPDEMSAKELTEILRNAIDGVYELHIAGTDAMLEARDTIESIQSQRDRLTALLNDMFPTCVETIALCERMMMYWRRGMTTAAAAGRKLLEDEDESDNEP